MIENQYTEFRSFVSGVAICVRNICGKANGIALREPELLIRDHDLDFSGKNSDVLLRAIQAGLSFD